MDLSEIKSSFPAESAALVHEGVALERDRILAHLKCGTETGQEAYARTAVESGAPFDGAASTFYLQAMRNRSDQTARQIESDKIEAVLGGAAPATDAIENVPDLGDQIVALIDSKAPKQA